MKIDLQKLFSADVMAQFEKDVAKLDERVPDLTKVYPNLWAACLDDNIKVAATQAELVWQLGDSAGRAAFRFLAKDPKPLILASFDPELSPGNDHNREAAKAHGLRFDSKKGAYVDAEGALVRDRFGQPF